MDTQDNPAPVAHADTAAAAPTAVQTTESNPIIISPAPVPQAAAPTIEAQAALPASPQIEAIAVSAAVEPAAPAIDPAVERQTILIAPAAERPVRDYEAARVEPPVVGASASRAEGSSKAPAVEPPIAIRPAVFRRTRPNGAPPVAPPAAQESAGARSSGSRGGRFALLAASIALAAGFGGAVGAAGFAAVSKLGAPAPKPALVQAPAPAPLQRSELAEETKALKDSLAQMRSSMRIFSDNLGSLRANIENSGKATNTQAAKLQEQIGRLQESVERIERSQSEPAARLAKVVETLERLERRAANVTPAPAPTTLAAQAAALPAPQAPAPAPESTASIPARPAAPPLPPATEVAAAKQPPVDGWTLRRVVDGVAFIESREGIYEVEVGDVIRGIGRVQEIKRQDGRWVVVTGRGVIQTR